MLLLSQKEQSDENRCCKKPRSCSAQNRNKTTLEENDREINGLWTKSTDKHRHNIIEQEEGASHEVKVTPDSRQSMDPTILKR